MSGQITQTAKEYTIEFGKIEPKSSASASSAREPLSKGTLVVKLGKNSGSLASPSLSEVRSRWQLNALKVPSGNPVSAVHLLGRKEEIKTALEALLKGKSVEFYGIEGIGKTALVKHLAQHSLIARAFPSRVIYHRSVFWESVSDLLQTFFQNLYPESSSKPTDTQILEALKNQKALLVLDDSSLSAKEVKSLVDCLPECTFLFASKERQLFGKGLSLELRGLELGDCVSLLAQELGPTFNKNERADAELLCASLKGNPSHTWQIVKYLQEKNLSLKEMAKELESAASFQDWNKRRLASLLKPQKLVLMVLAAFKGVGLNAEQIASLTQLCEVKSILETLSRLDLIEVEGHRYHLKNAASDNLPHSWNPKIFVDDAITYFKNWVQQDREAPERLLAEADAVLLVLEWALKASRWSDVLFLGERIEGILALSGQWHKWEKVLEKMVVAARATGDRSAKAFALHQLGTRCLCMDETSKARHYLTRALHIRRKVLHDEVGAQITSLNLKFILLRLLIESPSTLPPESRAIPIKEPKIAGMSSLLKWSAAVFPIALGGILFVTEFSRISPAFSRLASLSPLNSNSIPSLLKKSAKTTSSPSPAAAPSDREVKANPPEKVISSLPSSGNNEVEQKQSSLDLAPENPSDFSGSELESQKETNKPVLTKSNNAVPVLKSLVLKPKVKTWGATVRGTVVLSSPAPISGIIVTLVSSAPELAPVQPSVLIEPGQKQATFDFPTSKESGNLLAGRTIDITALERGISKTESLKLNEPPPEIDDLDLEAKAMTWGTTVRGTVSMDNPAPAGGVSVNLASSAPEFAPVPPKVLINAGDRQATFEFTTSKEGGNSIADGKVKITASYQATSKSTALTLERPIPAIEGIQLQPSNATSGTIVRGTVSLDNPAPAGGITVNLISSNPELAPIQSSVAIGAGQKQAAFEFSIPQQGNNLTEGVSVEITAFDEAGSKTTSLRVDPPQVAEPVQTQPQP